MSAPPKKRPLPYKIGWWIGRAIIFFVVGSVLWVLVYKFVPPPMTFTMLGNAIAGRGLTKRLDELSQIDPNMARAAIAGETGNFCSHQRLRS
jgi:monofunctional biosynthetic peptidoglycan transglycosylase